MVQAFLLALPLGLFQAGEEVPTFDRVVLVLAEEHDGSLISSFGHLFMVLSDGRLEEPSDLFPDRAINFGADLGPEGDGPWIGRYQSLPFHEMVRKYARRESRSLTAYELFLSHDELTGIRLRLQQRLRESFRYSFFRQNCGYYLISLLEGDEGHLPGGAYLTPRQSLSHILGRFEHAILFQVPDDRRILDYTLSELTPEQRQAAQMAQRDIMHLSKVQDGGLRLLLLRLAESNGADPARIRELRSAELSGRGAEENARRFIQIQQRAQDPAKIFEDAREGPSVALGPTHWNGQQSWGMRFRYEAGLRNPSAADRFHSPGSLRFLSLTLDALEGKSSADVILLQWSTKRRGASLPYSFSQGGEVSYRGIPSESGRLGSIVESWVTADWNIGTVSIGPGIHLGAYGIEGSPVLLARPSLRASGAIGQGLVVGHLRRIGDRELGWVVTYRRPISSRASIEISMLQVPDDRRIATALFEWR